MEHQKLWILGDVSDSNPIEIMSKSFESKEALHSSHADVLFWIQTRLATSLAFTLRNGSI
jgi:hypothetical protein